MQIELSKCKDYHLYEIVVDATGCNETYENTDITPSVLSDISSDKLIAVYLKEDDIFQVEHEKHGTILVPIDVITSISKTTGDSENET